MHILYIYLLRKVNRRILFRGVIFAPHYTIYTILLTTYIKVKCNCVNNKMYGKIECQNHHPLFI